jgi:hypothetical protein
MDGQLLSFDISPRPAKEGNSISISFDYHSDKGTVTLAIVDAEEKVIKYVKVIVEAGKGKTTFSIPKGWGPALFINHKDFIVGAITVDS